MELIENDLVQGSSGKFGKRLVYRQRGGKTIISSRPLRKRNPKTPLQQSVRDRFKEGVLYGRTVINDPILKAIYQGKAKGNQTAFNLALSDFCKAPEIVKHNVAAYSGQIGDIISIRAVDDFRVEWVKLVIMDAEDVEVEQGLALLSPNGADWIYTTTSVNPVLAGTRLVMSAADLPGNITTQELILE